jgi:hypothetical protein
MLTLNKTNSIFIILQVDDKFNSAALNEINCPYHLRVLQTL